MVPKSLGAAAFAAVLLTAGTTSLPIIWGRAIVEATDGGAQECSGAAFGSMGHFVECLT